MGCQCVLLSWISNCGSHDPACAYPALVHDCLLERIRPDQPELMALRRRWWQQAAAHLLCRRPLRDLAYLLQKPDLRFLVSPCFCGSISSDRSFCAPSLWRLQREAGLPEAFVLLPATSAIGSYKNPEFVAQALSDRDLPRFHYCFVALLQSSGLRSWKCISLICEGAFLQPGL